jgi:apolipoprotein N-acyltransferase
VRALVHIGAILASAFLFASYSRVERPWSWLGWVALVPWLAALAGRRNLREAVLSGALMAIAFTVGVFGWFADAFARYTHTPVPMAYALLIVTAALLQPQFLVFAGVRQALTARAGDGLAVSLAAASAWVGTEWLFPRLFGDTIGQGLLPFATFRQGADLAGASGLTLALLIVNQRLYVGAARWRGSRRQALWAAASAVALLCALAGYGAFRLSQLATWIPTREPLTAALVQASLDDYEHLRARVGTFAATRGILDAHMELSQRALRRTTAEMDLILWPETVYPTTFGAPKSAAGADLDRLIVRFVERIGVPLLFGTYDRDEEGEYNAAVLLEPGANHSPRNEVYRKRRLFPLTERVPWWLDSAFIRRRADWLGTWRPGGGPPLLSLDTGRGETLRIAPLICLDAVDPRLASDAARRGAELLLTLSNDGWFATGGGARLHLTVSAFRSIETRLPQLRTTNSGITAVIGPGGEIVEKTRMAESTAVLTTVTPGRRGGTLSVRWGNWLGPAACGLAPLFAWIAILRRASRSNGRGNRTPLGNRAAPRFQRWNHGAKAKYRLAEGLISRFVGQLRW